MSQSTFLLLPKQSSYRGLDAFLLGLFVQWVWAAGDAAQSLSLQWSHDSKEIKIKTHIWSLCCIIHFFLLNLTKLVKMWQFFNTIWYLEMQLCLVFGPHQIVCGSHSSQIWLPASFPDYLVRSNIKSTLIDDKLLLQQLTSLHMLTKTNVAVMLYADDQDYINIEKHIEKVLPLNYFLCISWPVV